MALVPVTRPLSADVDGPGGGAVVRDRAAQLRQRFVARGVLPAARAQHMSLRREAISERRRVAIVEGVRKVTAVANHAAAAEFIRLGLRNDDLVAQSAQQVAIEDSLTRMGTSLRSFSEAAHTKLRVLDDVEKQVRAMQASVRLDVASRPPATAAAIVDSEVAVARRLKDAVATCEACGKRVLPQFMKTHARACFAEMISATGASRPPPGGYDEGGSDAEEEGAVVLATRRRMRGGGATAECPFCGRECATERLGKHIETCIQGRVMSALRSVVLPGATSGVVHASPVRNVAVVVKTPSRLSLAWALPLVLGSHPIRDFEVRLSKRTSKRYGKTVAHTYEEHVVSTSRWCFSLPVAAKGAIIEGLLASTDYDRIAVRAVSEVGAGAWSEMIECVTTPGAVAPTCPLILRSLPPTSSSFKVTWCVPLRDGGSPIARYAILYSSKMRHTALDAGRVETIGMVPEETEIDVGNVLAFELTGLPGGTEFIDVRVVAVSFAGLRSAPSNALPMIVTTQATGIEKLIFELQRIRAQTNTMVDTYYYQGFLQRMNRLDLLWRLEADYAAATSSGDEVASAVAAVPASAAPAAAAATAPLPSGPAATPAAPVPTELAASSMGVGALVSASAGRSKRFQIKIASLKVAIEGDKLELHNILRRRGEQKDAMRKVQERHRCLSEELGRVGDFNGTRVDSSIIHEYTFQAFKTDELRRMLEVEILRQNQLMFLTKQNLIADVHAERNVRVRLEKHEDSLSDRRAAFAAFMREATRNERRAVALQKWSSQALVATFARWRAFTAERKDHTGFLRRVMKRVLTRDLRAAFDRWRGSADLASAAEARVRDALAVNPEYPGRGTAQLMHLENTVDSTVAGCVVLLADLADVNEDLSQSDEPVAARRARLALRQQEQERARGSGTDAAEQEEARQQIRHCLSLARVYVDKRELDVAEPILVELEALARLHSSSKALLGCYAMWSVLEEARAGERQSFTKAVVVRERHVQLSRELCDPVEEAEALNGLGNLMLRIDRMSEAVSIFKRQLVVADHAKFIAGVGSAHRGLEKAALLVNDKEQAGVHALQAVRCEEYMTSAVSLGFAALRDYEQVLNGVSLHQSAELTFQHVPWIVPHLKIDLRKLKYRQNTLRKDLASLPARYEEADKWLTKVRAEIERLNAVPEGVKELASEVIIGGASQLFDVGLLRRRLVVELKMAVEKLESVTAKAAHVRVQISNIADDVDQTELSITVAQSNLGHRASERRPFRCIAFNGANALGNDVLGTALGGRPHCAASSDNFIYLFDVSTGEMVHCIPGDKGGHFGELVGHAKPITALYFTGGRVYSGSVDCTVRAWDVADHGATEGVKRGPDACLFTCTGHEATVWAIVADAARIFSGGADCRVFMWDARNGGQLATIEAHHKAVSCLGLRPTGVVTGGHDCAVHVWTQDSVGHVGVRRKVERLNLIRTKELHGHLSPVTVLAVSNVEIVSGAMDGTIIIWDVLSGEQLRSLGGHGASVSGLQFDSLNVVSVSHDCTMKIHDSTEGATLTTMKGHSDRVIAVQYDLDKAITASADGKIVQWAWTGIRRRARHKYHIYGPKDTLAGVCKKYGVHPDDFKAWNRVKDSKDLYVGQSLIVEKRSDSTAHKDE